MVEVFVKMQNIKQNVREAASGVLLLLSALIALIWANSPWDKVYQEILHYPVGFSLGDEAISFSLHHFVNDGLMAIFFFVVGLEIKKELVVGELSTPKKALFPLFAAIGGMFVPALFYLAFNGEGSPGRMGWGIPMATDIAFAIGVLSLLSKRIPHVLKVFLMALAIVDDLGAVLVIAFFYSQAISSQFLAFTGLAVFIIFCVRKMGFHNNFLYFFLGCCLWFIVLKSGVHATVAGVIMGLMTPAGGPAESLIKRWHPYTIWLIMPVFAFFNAGVHLKSGFSFSEFLYHPVSVGVFLGLLLGKPLGILLFSYLARFFNLSDWPAGFSWVRLTGIGFLAGIGFTMSLFISHLSFFESHPELSVYSKLGILLASLLAMIAGLLILFFAKNKR